MTSSTPHITGTERIAELNDELYVLNDEYGIALMKGAQCGTQVLAKHLLTRSYEILLDFQALLESGEDREVQTHRTEIKARLQEWFAAFRACEQTGRYDDDLGIQARRIILQTL